nr:MAG TPA: hypothetical protein [Caudoviricetes sp.]
MHRIYIRIVICHDSTSFLLLWYLMWAKSESK